MMTKPQGSFLAYSRKQTT